MSAESDKLRDSFADQLASYDERLHAMGNSSEMLAEIQEGIGQLLASSVGDESEVRQVLQELYHADVMREETFQLTSKLLDLHVSENVATFPVPRKPAASPTATANSIRENPVTDAGEDIFRSTTVIPDSLAPEKPEEGRVQVGSVLRDRFLLQEKVSGGGMGVVYKALDRRLAESGSEQQWVAIKVLSPKLARNAKALRALQQEAAKGRCLLHPNIVRFIDLDRDDDIYYLVMEWLEGQTLASILDSKDQSGLDKETAFRIVSQVGDALDYAHRCGIVHADVKPGNIMIMPNGDAKLFDFGVARIRQKQSESEVDPNVLSAITPAYSSMQVLAGEEPDVTDDIFSLASLLYRLVAGYRVFGPRNAAEAARAGMKPERLESLGEGQWRALNKALSYSRVLRFESVRDFIDAFEHSSSGPLIAFRPEYVEERSDRRSGGRLLTLVLLLGALAGFGYQFGYLDSVLEQMKDLEARLVNEIDDGTLGEPVNELAAEVPIEAVAGASGDEVETKAEAEAEMVEVAARNDEEITPIREIPSDQSMGPASELIDFSSLPKATAVVPISVNRATARTTNLAIREDTAPAIIDFVRDGDLGHSLTLKLEEVGFSGNRSPWAAGQYDYSNSGIVHFPAGAARARITLTMASDPLREADQQSTLRLREIDFANSELATLIVSLEDDDQRSFESQLPPNTIAFAASQTSVRETVPAVQIDLVRFNPDASAEVVWFSVKDITATEGEDYFAPGNRSISFGPKQRSARLLIPLVQDSAIEGDEAFAIELQRNSNSSGLDVYERIVVMIRDDEPQAR